MGKIIHVDIKNEAGKTDCWETTGGFWLAIRTLYVIWRYGGGQLEISPLESRKDNHV